MKKAYPKLIAACAALLLAITMIVSVTYAWLTVSRSPTANGIQVAVSGGNVIKLAPDITETVTDETGTYTVHYPGEFSDKLHFDTSALFDASAPLTPVSTSDGLNWLIPTFDESTGALKDIKDFDVDTTLSGGGYAYIDFWIVSPGSDYNIRVSTDSKAGDGSYFTEVPDLEKNDDTASGFSLKALDGRNAASARVGFLVNKSSMPRAAARYANPEYGVLLGNYQEKGEEYDIFEQYRFTIYEPNGTYHPFLEGRDGDYLVTRPLSYDRYLNTITETDIRDRVTVQTCSLWRDTLPNALQASLINHKTLSLDEAKEKFYTENLQWQLSGYLTSGSFFKSTSSLYACALSSGEVTKETIEKMLLTAGATDDITITSLERNVPQRVRMYIWLEGQDPDCVNEAYIGANTVALSVELSGATQ